MPRPHLLQGRKKGCGKFGQDSWVVYELGKGISTFQSDCSKSNERTKVQTLGGESTHSLVSYPGSSTLYSIISGFYVDDHLPTHNAHRS